MSDKATTPTRVPVEQIFNVPAGSETAFTSTDGLANVSIGGLSGGVSTNPGLFEGGDSYFEISLNAPNLFSIVDQQLRRTAAGDVFVDIVIEVEEVTNANEYEAAVSRQIVV